MRAGMAAQIAAADVDPNAQQIPSVAPQGRRRLAMILMAIGILTYLLGLIATIPAAVFLDESDRLQVGGTIWNGEAVVGSAIRVDWDFAPLISLSKFAWSADWHITGAANDIAGSVTQDGDQLQLENISGQADGALLDALFPRLPISCDFKADMKFESLYLGGEGQKGLGNLRTGPVLCMAKDLAAIPVELPALQGDMMPTGNATSGALMTAGRNVHLVELRLSPKGSLSIWPTQMATRRLPFLQGQRYDTIVE